MTTLVSIAPVQVLDARGSVFLQHTFPLPLIGHDAQTVLDVLADLLVAGEIVDTEAVKRALAEKVKANEAVVLLAGLWENISEWQHYGAQKCRVHVTRAVPACMGDMA